jgi:hypothetical protein
VHDARIKLFGHKIFQPERPVAQVIRYPYELAMDYPIHDGSINKSFPSSIKAARQAAIRFTQVPYLVTAVYGINHDTHHDHGEKVDNLTIRYISEYFSRWYCQS